MKKVFSIAAISLALVATASAGDIAVHDAVLVTDGSTRLVNCENTRGAFLLVRPLSPSDVYVIRSDVRNSALSDVLERTLPAGWVVRYGSPNVEGTEVNLVGQTYWADALKTLSHDFNLIVTLDGERREIVIGRL